MNTENRMSVRGMDVEVVRKPIKNLHIGVYPPNGRVRVAAPPSVTDEAVRLAVVTRLGWIKRQQSKFAAQARQSLRSYVSGETHFHLGTPYRLRLREKEGASKVRIVGDRLELSVPPGKDREFRERVIQSWQRDQLRERLITMVRHWASAFDVPAPKYGIKRMRTKWGSCSAAASRVWLNLELVKKPARCIDYVVAHEVAHLVTSSHGDAFKALMDRHVPTWRSLRDELNAEPLGHERWAACSERG